MIRVLVWNEFYHDQFQEDAMSTYPGGIHNVIKSFLETDSELSVSTATLEEFECGLSEETLKNTDVLIWWGHCRHADVPDEIALRVREHVLKGMGFIALHSAHFAKPFKLLMGTSCSLKWRDNEKERIWCSAPGHPIARGIPEQFELPSEEMYGEFFDIPNPDDTVFIGWFKGGEVFRSGCTFQRGLGKIFYFQPGHETNHSYHNKHVKKIINNAVKWAYSEKRIEEIICPKAEPLES